MKQVLTVVIFGFMWVSPEILADRLSLDESELPAMEESFTEEIPRSKDGQKIYDLSPVLYHVVADVDKNFTYDKREHSSLPFACGRAALLEHRVQSHSYFYGKNSCMGRMNSIETPVKGVHLDASYGVMGATDTPFIMFGIRISL